MTVIQDFLIGDSLTAGKLGGHDFAQGGGGSWAERDGALLGNILGLGPRISSGIRLTETASTGIFSLGEWSSSGTKTASVSTDPFYKYPYNHGNYGFGSTSIWTYTVPAWMPPVCGFSLYYIDMNDGTHVAGNWSFNKNGGSEVAMGQTLTGDNAIHVFYVSTSLVAGDTIRVRCANTAGTAVYCFLVGIEPYFLPPSTTSGYICHNLAIGGSRLHYLVTAGSGDPMAFLDSVVAGTGSPIVPNPDLITIEHVNDVAYGNLATYTNDIATFYSRAAPLATLGYINPHEVADTLYNTFDQGLYRDQLKTSAALHSIPVLDWYDWFSARGITGNTPMVSAGLLESDNIHLSQLGHDALVSPNYWFRRSRLGIGRANSLFVSSGSIATAAPKGKIATHAAQAGSPPGIN